MAFFTEHPLRRILSNEVHARPPVTLRAPAHIVYLVFMHDQETRQRETGHLALLAQQLGVAAPPEDAPHFLVDGDGFSLKWEKHNEFSSYTFFRESPGSDEESDDPLLTVPAAWRREIPGQLIVATRVELHSAAELAPEDILPRYALPDTPIVASKIAGDAGWVFTDFQIRENFSHFLILNESLTPRQAGRSVQRLLEIETYRVISLLAFPVAKEVATLLTNAEGESADIMSSMNCAASSEDDSIVLTRLSRLATDIEQSIARTAFRFGAASAYYRLVQQRIGDLRESRVPGHLTIREFMDRRLTPAINTCETVAQRQEDLSKRITRSSQLLRTRVDIALEKQNQQQLAQMNRRARQQLQLQQTVEGLSIVAITYYGSQLVNYLAKGAERLLAPLTPELITAIAIPCIAAIVALGLRRTRRHLLQRNE